MYNAYRLKKKTKEKETMKNYILQFYGRTSIVQRFKL